MTQIPSINDTAQVLWCKIAWNLYTWALTKGASGLIQPEWPENIPSLQDKITTYSFYLATI